MVCYNRIFFDSCYFSLVVSLITKIRPDVFPEFFIIYYILHLHVFEVIPFSFLRRFTQKFLCFLYKYQFSSFQFLLHLFFSYDLFVIAFRNSLVTKGLLFALKTYFLMELIYLVLSKKLFQIHCKSYFLL